ncbi:MAG: DUF2934 domain-containing protein [Terracidiphilus sp.]
MSTNYYQIARDHATNEIAEIYAQIQRLTRRKELLEKLLEPLKLLVPESGPVEFPASVSDGSNTESSAREASTQLSSVDGLVDVSGPEPGPLVTPAPTMRPEVEETNVHAGRNEESISHDEVARLAYHFWNERGQVHGHHEADWFRAAHELQSPSY